MKVTRIAYGQNLNQGKTEKLFDIADRLGRLRSEVWQRFGSIGGVKVHFNHRTIRDQWLAEGRPFDVPARLWKMTLQDAMADIKANCEAAKVKARKAIRRHTRDENERKRLYTLLKYDQWTDDPYLYRVMRKYWKRGHNHTHNQIVLDTGCYKAFERNGRAWVKVMSLDRGQRIAIPLSTNVLPTGTLRLMIREGKIEIHYAVDERPQRPSGDRKVGIDKGYTEVFVDSDGDKYGKGLGETLAAESDYLKVKYQRRSKLKAIAKKKPHKADHIKENNLGRKKLNRRKSAFETNVKNIVYNATHELLDKAGQVVCEDLTSPIPSKNGFNKNVNRKLNAWTKGVMAQALEDVSRRRGSTVHVVNAAYTSQIDSRHGVLLGQRKGDKFHCFDGEVLDADYNAARNVLARLRDPEIDRWTPSHMVKSILLKRTPEPTVGTAQPGHQLQSPGDYQR